MSDSKRYCKNCGKELVQTGGHRQKDFCCDNCRKAYWHKNQKHKEKECQICGRKFIAKDPRAKYCSVICRKIGKTMKTIRSCEQKSITNTHECVIIQAGIGKR